MRQRDVGLIKIIDGCRVGKALDAIFAGVTRARQPHRGALPGPFGATVIAHVARQRQANRGKQRRLVVLAEQAWPRCVRSVRVTSSRACGLPSGQHGLAIARIDYDMPVVGGASAYQDVIDNTAFIGQQAVAHLP